MILNMGGGGVVPKLNYDETIITPGTENQIVPSGTYHRGDMTILGDSDLTPENIVKDVDIFGVVGTYDPLSEETDLLPNNIRQGVDILGVTGTMIEGDGTWVERTTATTAGKTIYSSHSNPNAVYGGGYLPQTRKPGTSSELYCHACAGIYGTTVTYMTCTTTRTYGDGTPSIGTSSITISGNKITVPTMAYTNEPAFTLNLTICRV